MSSLWRCLPASFLTILIKRVITFERACFFSVPSVQRMCNYRVQFAHVPQFPWTRMLNRKWSRRLCHRYGSTSLHSYNKGGSNRTNSILFLPLPYVPYLLVSDTCNEWQKHSKWCPAVWARHIQHWCKSTLTSGRQETICYFSPTHTLQ